MLRKSLLFILSLTLGIYSFSQDCENYFLYQQNDELTFTFQGFMYEPVQTLYTWDFGDGNSATGKTVTHTFDPQGSNIFEVCLFTETYDSVGNPCQDTSCMEITVGDPPGCVSFFFSNQSISNPLTWTFSDFSSGNPTSWSWSFGDGSTSTLQSPLHTFPAEGTYQVCLTIYDSIDNCQDEYCEEITVNAAPNDDCESDFTYTSTDLITFDFTAYMIDTTQQATDYQWDFGDGNYGSGEFITYTYQNATPGFYTVCLTTTYVFQNGDTCEFTSCHDVYVGTTPNCQALFSWAFGSQPLSVDFTDLSVGGPTSWYWDFDDSTYSTLQNPTHTFYRDGIFDVCLTITNDSTNCSSTICTEVQVTNVPPPVDCDNTITTTPGADNYSLNFHGDAFSGGNNVNETTTFSWNFGDGNTASGQDVSHTYSATGSYAVTLATVSLLNNSDTCIAYGYDSIFITDESYCIEGNVYLDTMIPADDGYVHLMQFDASNGNLLNVETSTFDNAGHYLFEDINFSNGTAYYVQATLSSQSSQYGQYLPTYHYNALNWADAQIAVAEECPAALVHNIMLLESTSYSSGSNSISGVVYDDATRGTIEGMEVLLMNEAMEALTYAFTDADGMFEFSTLADGSYYIYPEMVGIETSGFMVSLNSETPDVEMIIIIGDGTASLSVEEYSVISVINDIYPNPANGLVNISLSAEKAVDVAFTVFNQLGQQMILQAEHLSKGVNNIEVNISNLPESVYYMKMQAKGSKPLMRTFVKVN